VLESGLFRSNKNKKEPGYRIMILDECLDKLL
jgi:hypothetical protein